jgi:hypothetical protein
MANRNSTTLKTALRIATARAKVIRAAEWQSRLDADCYSCRRDGATWIAEHAAAGQRFEFTLIERFSTGHLTIGVKGMSGQYQIWAHLPGEQVLCSCPAFQRSENCKHAVAFRAVKEAAQDQRTAAALPLAA